MKLKEYSRTMRRVEAFEVNMEVDHPEYVTIGYIVEGAQGWQIINARHIYDDTVYESKIDAKNALIREADVPIE